MGSNTGQTVTVDANKVGEYDLTLKVTNALGCESTCSKHITVLQADQIITFNTISPKTYGDAPVDLTLLASSTSGFPVSFISSNTEVISIAQDGMTGHYWATILKTGPTTITAIQEGNINYNPAPIKTQDFNCGSESSFRNTDYCRQDLW